MRPWSAALVTSLGALSLAGAPGPAVASMRAGAAARPVAPRMPRVVRDQGAARARPGDGSGRDGSGRGDGRRSRDAGPGGNGFGGDGFGADGFGVDDLGFGLAGGYVGAAGAQPGGPAPFPLGAPPPPFPGVRPPPPAPCVRPEIITIGPGVRGADKIRVVYGAPPPCDR